MKVGRRTAIALGTNLGDRLANLQRAVDRLAEDGLENLICSSVYETQPWGIEDQPLFLNAVVVGDCDWRPPAILHYLKSLETELGRRPGPVNGPRVIDLDLLAWGDAIIEGPDLVVPHPRLMEREFVLAPLSEIWPDWVHPVAQETVRAQYVNLGKSQTLSSTIFAPPLLSKENP